MSGEGPRAGIGRLIGALGRRPVRLVAANAVSAVVVGAVAAVLPERLVATADVIGFPVVNDFDAALPVRRYYLGVLAFPALAILLYLVMAWRVPQPDPPEDATPASAASARQGGAPADGPLPTAGLAARVGACARSVAVGLTLSLAAPVLVPLPGHFLLIALPVAAVYALLLALAAPRLARRLVEPGVAAPAAAAELWRARVNAVVAAVAGVGALFGVSRALAVVEATGPVRRFPWLPVWLAFAVAALAVVLVARGLRRTPHVGAARATEIRAIYSSCVPAVVFALAAALPGSIGDADLFHLGESIAAAELVSSGHVPWRDAMFIHGLLEDPGKSLFGLRVFDESCWGSMAGQEAVLRPLVAVSAYALVAAFLRDNRRLLVLWAFLLPVAVPPTNNVVVRLLFAPWVVLSFLWLLRSRRASVAILTAGLAVGQALIVPETAYFVPGLGCALAVFEACRPGRGPLAARFRLTLCALGTVVASLGVAAIVLQRAGALAGFLEYYRSFAHGHLLKGAHPIELPETRAWVVLALLPLSFVVVLWRTFLRARARRSLTPEDWAAFGLVAVAVPYFEKFLARPDVWHLEMVVAVAAPVVGRVALHALEQLDALGEAAADRRGLGRLRGARVASTGALALALLAWGTTVLADFDGLRGRLVRAVRRPDPPARRLGYALPGATVAAAVGALRPVFDAYVSAREPFFDFTNDPALYHYLLGLEPASKFYHVSMAIDRDAQRAVVDALEARRPKLVAYHHDAMMWTWDGVPNSVRHRDVSAYLLRTYRPLAVVAGTLLLRRDDQPPLAEVLPALAGAAVDAGVYRTLPACAWGYVPSFDRAGSSASESGVALEHRTETRSGEVRTTIAMPADRRRVAYLVFAFDRLGRDQIVLSDGRGAGAGFPISESISFRTKGEGNARTRLHVAACPQWHAYEGDALILRASRDHGLREVRWVAATQER